MGKDVKNATFVARGARMKIDLNRKLPKYLTERGNIVRHIIFTAAFALLFINLYKPFGVQTWFEVSTPVLIVYSSGVILTGILVVAISRIIMYHTVRRGRELLTYQYLLWVAAEIVSMALFYTFYEKVFLKDGRSFPDLLYLSVLNTSLTLLLPYSVLWLYFSWHDKKMMLAGMTEMAEPAGQKPMIPLRDDRGILRLSLKRSDILYLRGSDNYVTVWYQSHDKLMKFMLRNTLRAMEEELHQESVIRCHRSFLVNIEHVKLIRREKDGLQLELDCTPPESVPVSRTYMQQVLTAFGQEA
jgi:hypothetical protein